MTFRHVPVVVHKNAARYVTDLHDIRAAASHTASGGHMRDSTQTKETRVHLTRGARAALARLSPSRREALSDGFKRVGEQLLSSAERVAVEPGWATHTWPRRRYPQQCYARTTRYVLDHLHIDG